MDIAADDGVDYQIWLGGQLDRCVAADINIQGLASWKYSRLIELTAYLAGPQCCGACLDAQIAADIADLDQVVHLAEPRIAANIAHPDVAAELAGLEIAIDAANPDRGSLSDCTIAMD